MARRLFRPQGESLYPKRMLCTVPDTARRSILPLSRQSVQCLPPVILLMPVSPKTPGEMAAMGLSP